MLECGPAALYCRRGRAPFGFTYVSGNAQRMVGARANDFGKFSSFWQDAIHPDDVSRVVAYLAAIDPSDPSPHSIDYRFGNSREGFRWLRDQWHVASGTEDDIVLLGSWTDITSHKRSEQALDLSRRRLQALFNYSLDAILLTDDEAHLVEVNPAGAELFGFSRQELLKKTVWDLTPSDMRVAAHGAWNQCLTSGELSGDFAILRSDGAVRHTESRAVAHVLPGTHLLIFRDVTVRTEAEESREQYLARLEVLAEIDRAILHAESPEAVADAAVVRIVRLISCARASVSLFDASHSTARILAVWAAHDTTRGTGVEIPLTGLRILDELLDGHDVVVNDAGDEPNPSIAERGLLAEGLRGYLAAPLRIGQRTIGTLNILSDSPWTASPEQRQIAKEVADRLAVALTNARLIDEMRTSNQRLATISKRILEVQETERRDIARELHDEIGQVLTGLKLGLGVAQKKADDQTTESLRSAERLVDDLILKVRRLSLNLRPPVLDELGLLSALLSHFERFTTQTGIAVRFTYRGLDRRFSLQAETAAYRIVQESLTNIARHANVREALVDVGADDRAIDVSVVDAGHGFDVPAVRRRAGTLGLVGMEERVTLLGGRFTIASAPEGGTRVDANIPINS